MTGTCTSQTALRRRSGIAADYARRPQFPLARSSAGAWVLAPPFLGVIWPPDESCPASSVLAPGEHRGRAPSPRGAIVPRIGRMRLQALRPAVCEALP